MNRLLLKYASGTPFPKDPKDMSAEELKQHADKLVKDTKARVDQMKVDIEKSNKELKAEMNRLNATYHEETRNLAKQRQKTKNLVRLAPVIGAGMAGLGAYGLYRHYNNDKKRANKNMR